jgi:hypothetical protein
LSFTWPQRYAAMSDLHAGSQVDLVIFAKTAELCIFFNCTCPVKAQNLSCYDRSATAAVEAAR